MASDVGRLRKSCARLWRLLAMLPFPSRWWPCAMSTRTGGNVNAFDGISMSHDLALAPPIGTSAIPSEPPASRDAPSVHALSSLLSNTSSSQSSRHRRKCRGSVYSRTRALFRYIHRCRKQRAEVGPPDVIILPIAELSSIQLLEADDDDALGEWEDLERAKLHIAV